MRTLKSKYVTVQGGRVTHSMASQRMNERFNKFLDPFINLCHACGHKLTSVLLVWYDGGENVGTTETYGKIWRNISNGCQFCDTLEEFGSATGSESVNF